MAGGEMVRVGLLTAHLTRAGGGVYTSVRDVARALGEERGMEVEVFGPERRGEEPGGWEGVKVRTARALGPGVFSFAPGLVGQLTGADLDLVHLHGLWMHTSVASAAFTRRTGRPHLISPHGMLDTWALHNSGWKKRLAAAFFENANLRSAACVHALNAAEEESIRDYGLTAPVCVIPNGVRAAGGGRDAAGNAVVDEEDAGEEDAAVPGAIASEEGAAKSAGGMEPAGGGGAGRMAAGDRGMG